MWAVDLVERQGYRRGVDSHPSRSWPASLRAGTVRPRHVLLGVLVCLIAGLALTAGARAATDPRAPVDRLFDLGSVWNAPLADNAALDPTNSSRMSALYTEMQKEISSGTGPWISETSYSTPLYIVPAGQPTVPVTVDNAGHMALSFQPVVSQGVPIPANAQPAAGTDGHLTVFQPSSDTLWEFRRAN